MRIKWILEDGVEKSEEIEERIKGLNLKIEEIEIKGFRYKGYLIMEPGQIPGPTTIYQLIQHPRKETIGYESRGKVRIAREIEECLIEVYIQEISKKREIEGLEEIKRLDEKKGIKWEEWKEGERENIKVCVPPGEYRYFYGTNKENRYRSVEKNSWGKLEEIPKESKYIKNEDVYLIKAEEEVKIITKEEYEKVITKEKKERIKKNLERINKRYRGWQIKEIKVEEIIITDGIEEKIIKAEGEYEEDIDIRIDTIRLTEWELSLKEIYI